MPCHGQAGASAWATGAVGRVHRQGTRRGESRTARGERAMRGDPTSGPDTRRPDGDSAAEERAVRAVAERIPGESPGGRGVLRATEQGDAGLGGGTVPESPGRATTPRQPGP